MHRRGSMLAVGVVVAVLALSSAQTTTTSAPYTTVRQPTTAEPVSTTAAYPEPIPAEPVPTTAYYPEPIASTAGPAPATAEPEPPATAAPTTYEPATAPPTTTAPPPAPCSSDAFSLMGKCGGAEHGYLRCPKGYWCSQWGYCGTTKEYRQKSLCARERRDDPAMNATKLGFSPDDKPEDYLIQDDLEAEAYDKDKTWKNCRTSQFHRWGKCGTAAHGHFRCKYGEWCSKWGYCSKYAGAAKDALCAREPRRHPKVITYVPAPNDDPLYSEPLPTTRRRPFRTTKARL